jgi:hypothetical protein
MRLLCIAITVGLALGPTAARGEPGLDNCVEQFPGGTIEHARTRAGVAPGEPLTGNVHICERSGETSFFALEYDPEQLAPIWVAYRLSDTFGPDRCGSVPRDHMRCYFGHADVQTCLVSEDKPADPFPY